MWARICVSKVSRRFGAEIRSLRPSSVLESDARAWQPIREVSSKAEGAYDQENFQQDRVYTSEQRDVVIDKLNAVRTDENIRKLLGPKLTDSLETHLLTNGSFSRLDELLKVPSVGPKTVRTLCDKLLGITTAKSRSPSSSSSVVRRTRSTANLVSPPLSNDFCLAVNLLGTIVVDVTFVSWALVDTKKKTLLDWRTISIGSTLSCLRDVVTQAAVIEKELPEADLFVFEEPTYGNRGGHHFKSHLSCALATSIHIKREANPGSIKMCFVKNHLIEKHFKATVGSETVSLQPFVQDIIDQKVTVGRSNVFISQDSIKYFKGLEAVQREQLSRAGLLSITFIDSVLNKKDTLDKRKNPDVLEKKLSSD